MTSLRIFQILKSKMGDEEAEAFVTYVDTTLRDGRNEIIEAIRRNFATKEDLADVRGELKTEIANVKSDVLRWMFAFFVTMLLAVLGLYFKK